MRKGRYLTCLRRTLSHLLRSSLTHRCGSGSPKLVVKLNASASNSKTKQVRCFPDGTLNFKSCNAYHPPKTTFYSIPAPWPHCCLTLGKPTICVIWQVLDKALQAAGPLHDTLRAKFGNCPCSTDPEGNFKQQTWQASYVKVVKCQGACWHETSAWQSSSIRCIQVTTPFLCTDPTLGKPLSRKLGFIARL